MSTLVNANHRRKSGFTIAIMIIFTVFFVFSTLNIEPVYGTGETAQVTATQLNVRSGAGTGYAKIGSLTKGKTFTVTGTAKDSSGVTWYRLNYNSKNGYVSSKYVNIKQNTVTPVSGMQGTVNTAKDPLIIRSGPGTGYSKLGTLAKGKTFSISGKVQDGNGLWWYQFSFNGKTGYASSAYVKTTTTSSGVTEVSGMTGTVATKSSPLIIRSGPGTSYSKLGTLAKGKTFAVTGKAQDGAGTWWYQFSFNGKNGYASSVYVTVKETAPAPDPTPGDTPAPTKGTVATQKDPLIIRSGPAKSYAKIGSIPKGKTFDILQIAQDSSGGVWYKLTYNGKTGYVSASYVTASGDGTENPGTGTDPSAPAQPVTFQMGTVKTSSTGLNVRSGPGTNYSKLTVLAKGSMVTITGSAKASNGKLWYTYQYSSSKAGYICSDYVTVKTITSDSDFETYLNAQGFPESYKAGLRSLHAAHPQWIFKASNVGYSWSSALSAESKLGRNLVSPSSPVSYRNPASYNSSTGSWTKYDGTWYAANSTVIAHYMDPRNFLNEDGIYQFMTQTYDAASQNTNTVSAVIQGSFMQTRNPGGGYSSYASLIHDAGKAANVNPNVLAAMIIQEQGWKGTSGLISGTYSGYAGYYNFFNIGAWTTSTMNSIQRGLWYAKGENEGKTSYARPWTTPYKSILGGAQYYSNNYVSKNQDSYYSKKFNVYNGAGNVGVHQYMTNVAGAASEGGIVKKAYAGNSNYPVVFEIPVFSGMPASNCPLP